MSGVDLGLIGLSGLRLDHTDAALEATGPALVNPNILDTISDSGAESGSDLDKSLQRVRWLGTVEPPEPQISLRDFIEQFIEAIAAIFQARNANFNADLIISDMMLDVLVGDILQRIEEQSADTLAQIDALNRWLLVMPGMVSSVGETPDLDSTQVRNATGVTGSAAVNAINVADVVSELGIRAWYEGVSSAEDGSLWSYNGEVYRAQIDTDATPSGLSYVWVKVGPAPTDIKSLIRFLFGLFTLDGLDGIGSGTTTTDLTLSNGYNIGISELGDLIDEFQNNIAGGTENSYSIRNANSTVGNIQYYFNHLRNEIEDKVGTYTAWDTLGDFGTVDYTLMDSQGFSDYTEEGGYLDQWVDVVSSSDLVPNRSDIISLMDGITERINSELASFVDQGAHGYESLSFYDFSGDWATEDVLEGNFYLDPDTDKLYVALQDIDITTWYNYVVDTGTGERYTHGMNDIVRYNDEVYISSNFSNQNNIPSSSSLHWDTLDITNGKYFSEIKDPRLTYYAKMIRLIINEFQPLLDYTSLWDGTVWNNTLTATDLIVKHDEDYYSLKSELNDRGDILSELNTGNVVFNEFDIFEFGGTTYAVIEDYDYYTEALPTYDLNLESTWPDEWYILPNSGISTVGSPRVTDTYKVGDLAYFQGKIWEAQYKMKEEVEWTDFGYHEYVSPREGYNTYWKDVTFEPGYYPSVDDRIIPKDWSHDTLYYKNDVMRYIVDGEIRYFEYQVNSPYSREASASNWSHAPYAYANDLWTDVTDEIDDGKVAYPDFSNEAYFKEYDKPISNFWFALPWVDTDSEEVLADFQDGLESLRTMMSVDISEVTISDAMEFTLDTVTTQIESYREGLFAELDRVMALANSDGAVYDSSGYLESMDIYNQAGKILYEDLGMISDYRGNYESNKIDINAELTAIVDAVPQEKTSALAGYFITYLHMINDSSARDDPDNAGVVQAIKDELYALEIHDEVAVATGLLVDPINDLNSIESTISGLIGSDTFNRSATHQGSILTNLLLMKDAIDDLESISADSTETEDLFANNFYTLKTLWEETVASQQVRDISIDDILQHERYINIDAEESGYNALRYLVDSSVTSILTDINNFEVSNAVFARDYFLHIYNTTGSSSYLDSAQLALDYIISSAEWGSDMGAESSIGYLKEVENIMERLYNATPTSVNQLERTECPQNDNKFKYLDSSELNGIHDAYLEMRGDLVFMLNKIDSVFGDVDYNDSSLGRVEAGRLEEFDSSFSKNIDDHTGNMKFQTHLGSISGWTTSDQLSDTYSSFRGESVLWNNSTGSSVSVLDRFAPSVSSLLEIISKFELFFESTQTSNDQIWGSWDLHTTGQMVDYATWGKITGRMKDIFYDLYLDWDDLDDHFDNINADGGETSIPANAMMNHLDTMYNNTKRYLHNQVLPAAINYSETFNEFHLAVETEARSWVTNAFAVTSPFEDLFFDSMKDLMGDSVSPEEMRLFAKILSMLLTLLIAMLGTNAQVREAISDLQTGAGTIGDFEGLMISQTLANNMIARASAMAQKLLKDEEGNMSGSGEFVTADPVSSQFFFDVVSFYQGSSVLMEMVEEERQRQRSQA